MCGLIGWLKFERPLDGREVESARRAASLLRHRGPDAEGEWVGPNCYLGHRRLKIVDLSDEANQPFWSRDRRLVTIYNGEVYNYIELREELERKGSIFHTSSDTEVFIEAFKQWGPKAFNRFDGMFAAAIYDVKENILHLVRDHLGQKPLYYHVYDEGVVFASELRAFMDLDGFSWRLDRGNFLKYLASGYYPYETTPMQGIRKLLPGTYGLVRKGRISLEQYWDSVPGESLATTDFAEAAEEVERLISVSCWRSMRADVPYGVFLSGGIDSGIVLRACIEANPDVSCFSVAMEDKEFDESKKAMLIARHLKIAKHRIFTLTKDRLAETFDRFLKCSDEPHGDPGYVNTCFLAASSRPDIAVGISGDGGDELFAGYHPFIGLKYAPFMNSVPGPIIALMKRLVPVVLSDSGGYLELGFRASSYLGGFPAPDATRFALWLSTVEPEELHSLCPWADRRFLSRYGEPGTLYDFSTAINKKTEGRSDVQRLLYYYQKIFLPEFVCFHTDRASMLSSLEVRSPLLSVPLVEFANQLPDHFKIRGSIGKYLLRELLRRSHIPGGIVQGKKQGFTFPVARHLRQDLRGHLSALVKLDAWDGDVISRAHLAAMVDQHLTRRRNLYRTLFSLIVFDAWLQRHPRLVWT